MPGFITRKWLTRGQVVEESTYPNEYAYITTLKVQTELEHYGMVIPLELELTFDPPVIQLDPEQARALRDALHDHGSDSDAET